MCYTIDTGIDDLFRRLKRLAKIVDSDICEIGIDGIRFHSEDYATIRRVREITEKLGAGGELSFEPGDEVDGE